MTELLLIILIILAAAAIALLLVLLFRKQDSSAFSDAVRHENDSLRREMTASIHDLSEDNGQDMERLSRMLQGTQESAAASTARELKAIESSLTAQLSSMETRLQAIEQTSDAKLSEIRKTMSDGMLEMRQENTKKLEEIRSSVDEKLQETLEKRIQESFHLVSERLEQVYKGLGEMQALAQDVGGLKKVLSGVKTSGILGEYQLKAILEEILSPEQYEENVATVPGSTERVEFAIRIPSKDGGKVYLPIDSKFPAERYSVVQRARDEGDRAALQAALKDLDQFMIAQARQIHTKYISVPSTTGFAIMFLPLEGLYAEVVNRGLIEQLQRDCQVSIAGPSTMAAILNSLQMGFQTLAIEKRSHEVWEVLGAVKTEFDKFEDALIKLQGHIRMSEQDLDALIGTRSRAIQKRLKDVQRLDLPEAEALLDIRSTQSEDD